MMSLRERHKVETTERLYETALRLFREQGYEAATVSEIAEEAGVSRRTFFNYFESKEAVLAQYQKALVDAVFDAVDEFRCKDGWARIVEAVVALPRHIARDPELGQAMLRLWGTGHELAEEDEPHLERFVPWFRHQIAIAQAQGELRRSLDVDSCIGILFDMMMAGILSSIGQSPAPSVDRAGLRRKLEMVRQGFAK